MSVDAFPQLIHVRPVVALPRASHELAVVVASP